MVIGVVAASVVGGLMLIGPPSTQRIRRLDARRVSDLQGIARTLDLYWTRHKALPTELGALAKEGGWEVAGRDPESGLSYPYRLTGEKSFELCATFAMELVDQFRVPIESTSRVGMWAHGRGAQCFALEAQNVTR
jgi:hypothetical protein